MRKCLNIYIGKNGNKKDNNLGADVAQLEHNNNKC